MLAYLVLETASESIRRRKPDYWLFYELHGMFEIFRLLRTLVAAGAASDSYLQNALFDVMTDGGQTLAVLNRLQHDRAPNTPTARIKQPRQHELLLFNLCYVNPISSVCRSNNPLEARYLVKRRQRLQIVKLDSIFSHLNFAEWVPVGKAVYAESHRSIWFFYLTVKLAVFIQQYLPSSLLFFINFKPIHLLLIECDNAGI